jgi:predicted NBD/HSP70 family sugar kinase
MMALVGCDLGGTTTRVAVRVDGTDTIRRYPTRVTNGTELVDHVIRTITDTVHAVGISPKEISGLGIGMPGSVDSDQRRVRLAANLGIGSVPLDLGGELSHQIDGPVTVENDVKTAALGLVSTLSDPDNSILTYLSVGTGIATATAVNGSVLRGVHGSAGEIGQIQLDPSGPKVPGAPRGSLEALAAGPAMADDQSTEGGRVQEATRYLARGVHTLFMVFDPHEFVIGGGAVRHAGFSRSLLAHLNDLREQSSVTASIIDIDRITILNADAVPGIDGALHLAMKSTQVSDRSIRSATNEGETP